MKRIVVLLLLVFVLLMAGCGEKTLCQANGQIPTVECEALLAFYNSTDGPNWFDSRGWNETDNQGPRHEAQDGGDCQGDRQLRINHALLEILSGG